MSVPPLPSFLANFTLEDVLEKVKGLRERDLDKGAYKEHEYKQMLDRLRAYLHEMLLKVKLSLAIPLLLKKSSEFQDGEVRSDILRIKKLCTPLLKSAFKYEDFNYPTGKNWCLMIDCNLVKAAEIFYNNEKLRNGIAFLEFLSPPAMMLFEQITEIQEHFPRKASKLAYSIDSPRIWEDIFEIPKRVSGRMTRETEELLKEKRELVKSEIIKKRKHIRNYDNVRCQNKEFAELETPVAFHIGFRNMHLMQMKHEAFEDILLEDRDLLQSAYQSTLQMNIETDRLLLQKRSKLLLQIEIWVRKYDEDVSTKMDELQQAKIQLNQQRIECNEFYKEYDRLGKAYFDLLAALNEKEMLAEAEMEKKKALAQQKFKLKKKSREKPPKNAKNKPEGAEGEKKGKKQKKLKK